MSQSLALYRVTPAEAAKCAADISQLKSAIEKAKSYVILQGTYMALEYLLSKISGPGAVGLTGETIGSRGGTIPGPDFSALSPGLISAEHVSRLHNIFTEVRQSDLARLYNAGELNAAGIYPASWHDDESSDLAYNLKHLADDFYRLKEIISQAETEGDILLSIVG